MKRFVRGLLATVVALTAAIPVAQPRPAFADYDIPNGHFYTQTGFGAGRGFTVADDGVSRFWAEMNRMGGPQAVGYPVSIRFTWDGFTVQAMQRLIMQWRPDAGQSYAVNVFDLLSQAGKDDWLLADRSTPRPLGPEFDAGLSFGDAMAKRLALLDQNPAIRAAYHGVAGDPIVMNGLPTSPVTDMGNHFALRAQRVLFQQWKETVPWAAAGQVTMALGGSIAAEAGLLPASALIPENAPGGPENAPGTAPVVRDTTVQLPAMPTMPAGGFGYGFQVDQAVDYDRALLMTAQAGFGWVKLQVPWKDVEPAAGQLKWVSFDSAVAKASARGMRVLFSVTTAPNWARPGGSDLHENGPPASNETFARFLGAMATRYKGKVAAYEVWNEQNLSREWGGPGKQSAAQYVAMLQTAHRTVKAADPNALVITGALTPASDVDHGQGLLAIDDLDYLRQMYRAGAKGFFDGVGVHPSGFNNAPGLDPRNPAVLERDGGFKAHRSFYFRNFEFYREIMVENGDAAKGLWLTEFGWASGAADLEWAYSMENSEQQQAQYLVEAFQIAKGTGYVSALMVFNLNHFAYEQALRAFAVLKPDWTPRPAYTALSRMPK